MAIAQANYAKFALSFSNVEGARTAVMHLLSKGDRIVVEEEVDELQRLYFEQYARAVLGIEVDFIDCTSLEEVEKSLETNTKLLWLQSPAGPRLKVCNLSRIAKLAQKKGVMTVCDSSQTNPFVQSPLLLGIDMNLHSCSAIDGHYDAEGGVIAINSEKIC